MWAMQHFDMQENSLSGTMPEVFNGMRQLRHWDTFANSLTGNLPQTLVNTGGTVGGGGGGGGGGGESDLAPKCRAIWTNCCITGDQVSPIVGPSPARRRGSAHAVRGAPGIRPAVATWLRHGYASAARVLLAGPVPRNLT